MLRKLNLTVETTDMAGLLAAPKRAAHNFPLDWLPDAEFAALEEALLAVEQQRGLDTEQDTTSVASHKVSPVHTCAQQKGEDNHEDSSDGTQVECWSRAFESTTVTTMQDGISHVETDAMVSVVTKETSQDSPPCAHGREIPSESTTSRNDVSSPPVLLGKYCTSPSEREDENGGDVEDIGKKKGLRGTPLQLHRRWRDLAVTDITASVLHLGPPPLSCSQSFHACLMLVTCFQRRSSV